MFGQLLEAILRSCGKFCVYFVNKVFIGLKRLIPLATLNCVCLWQKALCSHWAISFLLYKHDMLVYIDHIYTLLDVYMTIRPFIQVPSFLCILLTRLHITRQFWLKTNIKQTKQKHLRGLSSKTHKTQLLLRNAEEESGNVVAKKPLPANTNHILPFALFTHAI